MTDLFLSVVQMSITVSFIIPAVLLIRLLLRKAPKKYSYLLWAVVAFRLICPFSFESAFSLFSLPLSPSASETITLTDIPSIDIAGSIREETLSYLPIVDSSVEPFPTDRTLQRFKLQDRLLSIAPTVWIVGIAALLLYSIVTYLLLRRRLGTAIRLEGSVWQSDNVRSPFILGIIRPRIYIPFGLDEEALGYVLAHERCHIRRLDHIVKLIGFLLLTLHWFNPLVWLAYSLMSKDMEMSCDEKVLAQASESMGSHAAQSYSTTLLAFAANRRFPAASPLAFGETDVKQRITHVLNWKKAKIWIAAAAVMVCLAAVMVCSANPIPKGMVWAQRVQAEDIEKIELLTFPYTGELNYRLLSEDEFQKAAELINGCNGKHVSAPVSYVGGTSSQFRVTMKDGTAHSVCIYNYLIIDDEYYELDEEWAQSWYSQEITQPNAPLPAGYLQTEKSPYESQKWARVLKEDDVISMKLQIYEGENILTERSLSNDELSAAVTLVNGCRGKRLTSPDGPYGEWQITLVIATADGTEHTVTNCQNEYLIIDGDYYDTDSGWLESGAEVWAISTSVSPSGGAVGPAA